MRTTKQIITILLLLTVTMVAQNTYIMDVTGVQRLFYVEDNVTDDLDITDNYTIEFWINVRSTDQINYRKLMVRGDVGDDNTDYWSISIVPASDSYSGYKINFKNHRQPSTNGYIGADSISFDEWHFFSVSCDGSRIITHLDGTVIANYSASTGNYTIVAQNEPITFFGKDNANSAFDSEVDEIRISKIARYDGNNYTILTTNDLLNDDSNTLLLYHFNDNTQLPPQSSAANYIFTHVNGIVGNSAKGIQVSNYVAVGLPVELTRFEASINGKAVLLSWETATEVNNYGFSVQSKSAVSDNWKEVGFINGAGNSNAPRQYSFVDNRDIVGEVSYRLKQIDIDGKFEYSDVITVNMVGKATYKLAQNTPNPFNPSTKISFTIPEAGNVKLNVYNSLGQLVKLLVNRNLQAGTYQYQFDANGLPSGIYFYSITVNGFTDVKKMNLLK